jgi:hypothetical protein
VSRVEYCEEHCFQGQRRDQDIWLSLDSYLRPPPHIFEQYAAQTPSNSQTLASPTAALPAINNSVAGQKRPATEVQSGSYVCCRFVKNPTVLVRVLKASCSAGADKQSETTTAPCPAVGSQSPQPLSTAESARAPYSAMSPTNRRRSVF